MLDCKQTVFNPQCVPPVCNSVSRMPFFGNYIIAERCLAAQCTIPHNACISTYISSCKLRYLYIGATYGRNSWDGGLFCNSCLCPLFTTAIPTSFWFLWNHFYYLLLSWTYQVMENLEALWKINHSKWNCKWWPGIKSKIKSKKLSMVTNQEPAKLVTHSLNCNIQVGSYPHNHTASYT